MHHRTLQIAMDGSQKLPQRLLETARQLGASDLHIKAGAPPTLRLDVSAYPFAAGTGPTTT